MENSNDRIVIIGAGRLGFGLAMDLSEKGYEVSIISNRGHSAIDDYRKRCEVEPELKKLTTEISVVKLEDFHFNNCLVLDVSTNQNTKKILQYIAEHNLSKQIDGYASFTPDPLGDNIEFARKNGIENYKWTDNINSLRENLFNEKNVALAKQAETVVVSDFHRQNKEAYMKVISEFLLKILEDKKDIPDCEAKIRHAYEEIQNEISENIKNDKEFDLIHRDIDYHDKIIRISSYRGLSGKDLYQGNGITTAFVLECFFENKRQESQIWHLTNADEFITRIISKVNEFFNVNLNNMKINKTLSSTCLKL